MIIDILYISIGLIPVNKIIILYRFSTGDYKATITDFKLEDAAEYRVNTYTPNMRRLIEDKSLVVARHYDKAKGLIVSFKINRKIYTLEDE